MKITNPIALTLLALVLPSLAFAWGATGHRVVGEIAERYLKAEAQKQLLEIMGRESLAQAGNWADEIRSDPKWDVAKPWHKVGVPPNQDYFASTKDPDGDILRAIVHFEDILRDRKQSPGDRKNAVRFLSHFIGDLHQPLHTGRLKDHGGTRTFVKWFGKREHLHHVWDDSMIDSKRLSFTEITRFVDRKDKEEIKKLQNSFVMDWYNESRALVEGAYDLDRSKKLGWEYLYIHWPTVEDRLYRAGVRLAGVLNAALTSGDPEPLSEAAVQFRKKIPAWKY